MGAGKYISQIDYLLSFTCTSTAGQLSSICSPFAVAIPTIYDRFALTDLFVDKIIFTGSVRNDEK